MAEKAPSSQIFKSVPPSRVVRGAPFVSINSVTAAPPIKAAADLIVTAAPIIKATADEQQGPQQAASASPQVSKSFLPSQAVRDGPLVSSNSPASGHQAAVDEQVAASSSHHVEAPVNSANSPSYAAIVQGKFHAANRISNQTGLSSSTAPFSDPSEILLRPCSIEDGTPSIVFTSSEKLKLSENLKWVLIGKFSHGRPNITGIQDFFDRLQLQGNVQCAIADSKHIYIECSSYLDFYLIWLKLEWNIQGFIMRCFKWHPSFSAKVESPIAPVWIKIVGLALYLFDESSLMSIASAIGKPIKVDPRNLNHSCLSYARICIEMDASKPIIETINIKIVEEKSGATIETIKARIYYDEVPQFCSICSHIGHMATHCKRAPGSAFGLSQTHAAHTDVQRKTKKMWQPVSMKNKGHMAVTKSNSFQVLQPLEEARERPNGPHQSAAVLPGDSSQATVLIQHEKGDKSNAPVVEIASPNQNASETRQPEGIIKGDCSSCPVFVRHEPQGSQGTHQLAPAPGGTGAGAGLGQCGTGQLQAAGQIAALLQHPTDEGCDHGGRVRDVVQQLGSPPRPPKDDAVRPKSADSALGRTKKPLVQLPQLGPCTTVGQQRSKPPTKASWADEVEELEHREAKVNRMAIEHSFQLVRTPHEGCYKNRLILNIPGFQELSLSQQQETAATTMADFYQWKVTSDLEEEFRKDIVLREESDSEKGWQVVTHKKKRSPRLKAISAEDRQRIKASLDPDYDVERLQARIQQLKRDAPPK